MGTVVIETLRIYTLIMKLFIVALLFTVAFAAPFDDESVYDEAARLNPEYFIGQECIDLNNQCQQLATTAGQKIQCWVQFGLCLGTNLGLLQEVLPTTKRMQSKGRKRLVEELRVCCSIHQMCHH